MFFLYFSRLPWWINHSFLCDFDFLALGSLCSTPAVSNTTLSSSSSGGQVRPCWMWCVWMWLCFYSVIFRWNDHLHAFTHIFAYMSQGLELQRIHLLPPLIFLFAGSLFENEWSLKPEYKRGGNRLELADRLASRILWIGIANLLLCPVILVWQILYAFFSYTEVTGSHAYTQTSYIFLCHLVF